MNILDWSKGNNIGIALGETVYLWSYPEGNLRTLNTYEKYNSPTSLSFDQFSETLAIGTMNGNIEIWDTNKGQRIISTKQHES